MNKEKAIFYILSALALAVLIPFLLRLLPVEKNTRHIVLEAQKYGYSPSRIVVNQGDTILLKPTSLDVTHGFLLDGYPVEAIIKQQGIAYQKVTWEDDEGKLQTDWDKVRDIEFVAEKSGKFTFRCTQTCGNLHPFMTGELIVRPNTPYHLFLSLSLWVVFSLFLWFRVNPGLHFTGFRKFNILSARPWLNRILRSRSFQFVVILPNFILFYLFILSALRGSPVGNRNIAIIFVWILWWFVLKAIIVPLGGRIWCMICPLPAPAEWLSRKALTAVKYVQKPFKGLHHRFLGLQKDWPRGLRNIWLQNFLFLALISTGIILITRPFATALLFLVILGISILLTLFYRRRVFCQFICPVGGFLGTYSMASLTELRAIDLDVCKTHTEKSCLTGGPGGWACPWNQYLGDMDRNNYCGLCTECIKSCPKDNVGVFVRPFGSDLVVRGYDEFFNIMIMLVVAIAFSITMLGPWGFIKNAANVTESREWIPYLIYLVSVWMPALVVFPGLFALTAIGANRLTGNLTSNRTMILRLSYILIPVGIFFWIAFSLPQIMINYGYILSVLSDPLGLGWNIFGTADYPISPFIPEWIPLIQGTLLVTGLYFGLSRGYLGLKELLPEPLLRGRALILPALFALVTVNFLLRLYMG